MHFPALEGCNARRDISFPLSNSCPICGYLTIETRCEHDICSFCFWQDDGQDNPEANKDYIGPNNASSINAYRFEMYDWMNKLKEGEENAINNKIGYELKKLDNYIFHNESDRQVVMNQIDLLSKLFDKSRSINTERKLNWKFINEKQMTELKPAYNNTLPKAGRLWWQKLFGSE